METRRKILLADDVRVFLELSKSYFQRSNFDITTTRNGADALKLTRLLRPDLVVMDLHMPVMDGAEACRAIKCDPLLRETSVIMMVEARSPEDVARCREAGCDEILYKSLAQRQLLEVSRRFLQVRERIDQRVKVQLPVTCRIDQDNILKHQSVNIGPGGLFIASPVTPCRDAVISIEFSLPGRPSPFACKARVAWINPGGERSKPDFPPGFGVQFMELSPVDARDILVFVTNLEKEKNSGPES